MKTFAILFLLFFIAFQQDKIIAFSDNTTTIIKLSELSTPNFMLGKENLAPPKHANQYRNDLKVLNLNVFNDGSSWVYPQFKLQAVKWSVTYEITVDSDCPQTNAFINIAAT